MIEGVVKAFAAIVVIGALGYCSGFMLTGMREEREQQEAQNKLNECRRENLRKIDACSPECQHLNGDRYDMCLRSCASRKFTPGLVECR